jgi:hypothetical protein
VLRVLLFVFGGFHGEHFLHAFFEQLVNKFGVMHSVNAVFPHTFHEEVFCEEANAV